MCRTKALDRVLHDKHIDSIMHFAAFIEAGESMKGPQRFFRNNRVFVYGRLVR